MAITDAVAAHGLVSVYGNLGGFRRGLEITANGLAILRICSIPAPATSASTADPLRRSSRPFRRLWAFRLTNPPYCMSPIFAAPVLGLLKDCLDTGGLVQAANGYPFGAGWLALPLLMPWLLPTELWLCALLCTCGVKPGDEVLIPPLSFARQMP